MNSLSWLIYLASFSDGLRGIGLAGTIFGAVIALVSSFAYFMMSLDGPTIWSWDNEAAKRASYEGTKSSFRGAIKPACLAFAIGLVVQAVVPGKDTVYAIAASEMGEKALNTETGGRAVAALNAWLDRQISEEPQEKSAK